MILENVNVEQSFKSMFGQFPEGGHVKSGNPAIDDVLSGGKGIPLEGLINFFAEEGPDEIRTVAAFKRQFVSELDYNVTGIVHTKMGIKWDELNKFFEDLLKDKNFMSKETKIVVIDDLTRISGGKSGTRNLTTFLSKYNPILMEEGILILTFTHRQGPAKSDKFSSFYSLCSVSNVVVKMVLSSEGTLRLSTKEPPVCKSIYGNSVESYYKLEG